MSELKMPDDEKIKEWRKIFAANDHGDFSDSVKEAIEHAWAMEFSAEKGGDFSSVMILIEAGTRYLDSIRADLCPSRADAGVWQPISTAPRDGREIIAWLSSDKGFQDATANILYVEEWGGWCWASSTDPIKRPDLIHGWKEYPEPPTATKGGTE